MPDPGSHKYDIRRTRLRDEYDASEAPDQHADRAANEELQRDHPPVPVGDPDRAAGPRGTRGSSRGDPAMGESPTPVAADGIELRSAAFVDHTLMPDRYAFDNDNRTPPLEWDRVPEGTEELVLICEDPDAPNGTFVHWVVTGLPPTSTGIGEDGPPEGAVMGRNGFGDTAWGGPHPPVGDEPHRYFFRLYAIDRRLGLERGVSAEEVRAAMEGHVIGTGTLVGRHGR